MDDQGYGLAGPDRAAASAADRVLLARLLRAVRKSGPTSRSHLVMEAGMGKAVVAQYVDLLERQGIVMGMGIGESRGGRRPRLLRFRAERGLIGAIDLGATSVDVAVTDLSAAVLAHHEEPADVAAGPQPLLDRATVILTDLLARTGHRPADLWGVGMGVPGPVEFSTGTPVAPPIMPGWGDFSIRGYLGRAFPCPIYVDNDVNIHAVGEAAMGVSAGADNAIYVKVGTGIGAGIIVQGQLYRGSQGCAGDIGHIPVEYPGVGQAVCRCGNINCLEALAGGAALARAAEDAARTGQSPRLAERLRERGGLTAEDVGEMADKGDAWSAAAIRQAGRLIGYTLAGLVNFMNPSLIVIGGGVANLGDRFLAAIREMVYRRSLPLATRALRIERSHLGARAGVVGAAHVVLDQLFAPESILELLAAHAAEAPASV
jgi:glucokinase-like ROK family protein